MLMTGGVAQAISGGAPAQDGTYAFTAKITSGPLDDQRSCSGAVVDPQWVLTAKDCVTDKPAVATVNGKDIAIAEWRSHPDRNVALARLAAPTGTVAPATTGRTGAAAGEKVRIAGFGRTATEWVPSKFHIGQFTVDSAAAGTLAVRGAAAGVSVCKGDAGGPVIRENGDLVAVAGASWQQGCLGSAETQHDGAVGVRTDDLGDWLGQSIGQGWALVNQRSGSCLDQDYTAGQPHNGVVAGGCNYGGNQLWILRANPADGSLLVTNKQSGHCLDQEWSGGQEHPAILATPCNGGDNQHFLATANGDGSLTITVKRSGKCLDQDYSDQQPHPGINGIACNSGANQHWTLRPRPADTPAKLINRASGQCLDQDYSDQQPHPGINAINCNGGANQAWRLSGERLVNQRSGSCLDQDYSGGQPHPGVTAHACHNDANQKWELRPGTDGGTTLVNRASGLCLDQDYTGQQPHPGVIAHPCNGGANQRWVIL
ncbi:hypothetical protein D5S17_15720 [Pseudonocardiaceae bacterium YIM PH 21723]|nr:hypothetical protein D5S17_15720 [Pseudonocardiaceae bacterium YIM PH 21723]